MNPKVSINLCCYNSEPFLRDTLESIINQTYEDWELVIINDGSTDSTEAIVKEYIEKGYPIVYHYQKNHGLGYSRNEALKRSSGEFIAFIDHDDMWLPYKLEKQVAIFKHHEDIDFIYSNYFILDKKKRKAHIGNQPCGFVFEQFLHQYPVGIMTVLLRKKVLNKMTEYFDVKLNLCEEYDFFMRVLINSKAYYIDDVLAVYRIHPNMLSLRFRENYVNEWDYVSAKLKKLGININAKSFEAHEIEMSYLKARIKMSQGDLKEAIGYLKQYKFHNHKFLILYLAAHLPKTLWFLLEPLWRSDIFFRKL